MRKLRRIVVLALVVGLTLAACGGGNATDTTAGGAPDTSSATAPETQESTTTTTAVETTTTVPLDPIESLAAAAEERSIAVERDLLVSTTEGLCALAAELPEGVSLEERLQFSSVTPINNFAGFHEISLAQAYEFYALMVETACPENASLLAFSSTQYASAIGAEFSVGDCFLASDFLNLRIPSECAEPHNGEVIAVVEVPEGVQYPTPGEGSIFEVMESIDLTLLRASTWAVACQLTASSWWPSPKKNSMLGSEACGAPTLSAHPLWWVQLPAKPICWPR